MSQDSRIETTNAPSTSSQAPQRRQENPVLRYLYLLIAIGGLTYAGLGFISLSEATLNERWPTVEGQVVSNSVDEFERKRNDGTILKTYKASVGYRYEIDGKFYLSSELSLHPSERTIKGVAETEMEPYPLGAKVKVYYNPKDPNQAALRSSDTVGAYQAISAGLCIGLVCLALFFMSLRRPKE